MRKGRFQSKRVIKASRTIDEFVITLSDAETIDISNIFLHQTMKLMKVIGLFIDIRMRYDFDLFRGREKEIEYFLLYDMHIYIYIYRGIHFSLYFHSKFLVLLTKFCYF